MDSTHLITPITISDAFERKLPIEFEQDVVKTTRKEGWSIVVEETGAGRSYVRLATLKEAVDYIILHEEEIKKILPPRVL